MDQEGVTVHVDDGVVVGEEGGEEQAEGSADTIAELFEGRGEVVRVLWIDDFIGDGDVSPGADDGDDNVVDIKKRAVGEDDEVEGGSG